jgi:AcrR family transcriptional regulator
MESTGVIRTQAKQARSIATFESVLRAAGQLFDEVGPESTTTQAIAERAGVSIGTVYHFFPNKAAIETTITRRFGEVLSARLEPLFHRESLRLGAEEICVRSIDALEGAVTQVPGARGLLVSTLGRPRSAPNPYLDRWLANIEEFLKRAAPGLDERRRRAASETYVTMTATLVVAARHSSADLRTQLDEIRSVLIGYTRQLQREAEGALPA